MEKFEASKMGVLKQFVEDVRTYLRDYIEINFETMEEMMSHDKKWEKYSIKVKENKSKIYEKEAAKRLSSHKIAIVDECNTETSKKIADDFQAFLKKVYGVGSKLGDSVSSGTYNLRIIHDKGYYKGENDLHDEIFNKCIVQHITVENYKKCDLEKNPEFYAIIQELFIKEDIVNKQLTTFNWSETLGKSGKTWAFVSFKKDDTDKNTKKKDQYTYYRVFIAPDGKLSFDSCAGRSWMRRKDEWKNIIGYHQELIDKRKSEKRYDENIEGFFYTDINDIYNIITIGVLDEDKKLVGITEENFKNLLKKAEKLDELQTRMKEIYGEGEELLETFVSGLEQYNSQQEEHPFKARLLTNETVDEWEAYQRAKSEERLIELPTKIIRDGVSCPMVYHFYNVPYPEEEDIEECHLFEYIYKDSQLYLSVSAGPYSTVSIEATEIGESVFFSKEEALRKIHEIHRDYEIVDDKVVPRQRTKQKKD